MELRHEKMKSSQLEMEQHIVKNLKSLTREKALIAAGQKEIAEMTEGLKARLEITAEAMERQGEMQGDTHEEIIRDLAKIREQVGDVSFEMILKTRALEVLYLSVQCSSIFRYMK